MKLFTIADIHIGANLDEQLLYNQLSDLFISKILKEKPDVVAVLGDVSDKILTINSKAGKIYFKFNDELMESCESVGASLIYLNGTKSHDEDQLSVIEMRSKKFTNLDVRFYRRLTSDLIKGVRFLMVPEEYIKDKDSYFDKIFNDGIYDCILMHGVIDKVTVIAKNQSSEKTHPNAPVFILDDLYNICKGPIISGHIHSHMFIDNKFFYVGSFTRWKFGEEETKGFMIFDITNTGHFECKFIENTGAPIYKEVKIGLNSTLFNMDIEEALRRILDYKNTLDYFKLKLNIQIPENYENVKLFTDSVRELFALDKNINIVIKSDAVNKSNEKVKQQIEVMLKQYDYIFNKSISDQEKISLFIKDKFNYEVSPTEVGKYIY